MMVIRHEFYERATGYAFPVVAHEFTGRTLDEARSYFRSHLRYDRMLQGVTMGMGPSEGKFSGEWNRIQFKSVVRILQRVLPSN